MANIEYLIERTDQEFLLGALKTMPPFFQAASVKMDAYGIELPQYKFSLDTFDVYMDKGDISRYRRQCNILGVMPFSLVEYWEEVSRQVNFIQDFEDDVTFDDILDGGLPFRFELIYAGGDELEDFSGCIDFLISRGYTLNRAEFDIGPSPNSILIDKHLGVNVRLDKSKTDEEVTGGINGWFRGLGSNDYISLPPPE